MKILKIISMAMLLLSLQVTSWAAQEADKSVNHEDLIENIVREYPQYVEGFQVLGLGENAFENFLHENISDDENQNEENNGGEVLEAAMDTIKNGIQETFITALQEQNPYFIHNLKLENIHTMADLSPLTPLATMQDLTDPKIRYAMKYSGLNPDDTARPFMLPQVQEWIREWLINTPEIDRRIGSNETLFLKAIRLGDLELIKLLISAGANINKQDLSDDTPLHHAIDSRRFIGVIKSIESIKILLVAGADLNIKGCNGWTPLMRAVFNNNLESVKILLAAHANSDIQSDDGSTSLLLAVQNHDLAIIENLLAAQVNPNIKNKYGATVLHYAIKMPEVNMLLYAGADPRIRDKSHRSPADVAATPEIRALLMQYQGSDSH